MGLFDKILKKDYKEMDIYHKLLEIPCNYDGYDMVFEEGITDSKLYVDINEIITNGKIKIREVEKLTGELKLEEFYNFYDGWLEDLRTKGFVFHFSNDISMEEFIDGILRMLEVNEYNLILKKDILLSNYRNKLKELGTEEMITYDILMANIVAEELRKKNIELIALFDGFDNSDIAIIQNSKILELKELEKRLKTAHN